MPPPAFRNATISERRAARAFASAGPRSQPPQLASDAIAIALKRFVSMASARNARPRGSYTFIAGG
jgi:hypothetical protein